MVRSRGDRIADQIRVTDASRIVYAEALKNRELVPRGRDIAALARVEALVEGEATERTDYALEAVKAEWRRWLDVSREFVPKERWEDFVAAISGDEEP